MKKIWIIVTVALVGVALLPGATASIKRYFLIQHLLSSKDCSGCDLAGANLAGLDLSGIKLRGANLQGANLQGAKLSNAILTDANLSDANLTNADLGCATVSFNLQADDQAANVDLTVDAATPEVISQRQHILDFNFDADKQGATMSFNFGSCATLQGANLTGARLPDGSVYQ